MADNSFVNSALGISKAELDGQIVSGTLDALNSPTYASTKSGSDPQGSMTDTYNLSKSVLGAFYYGKGTAVEEKG